MDSQFLKPRSSARRSVSPTQQSFENASPTADSAFCFDKMRAVVNQIQSEVSNTCSPASPPRVSANNNTNANINTTSLVAQSRSMCRYCHTMHPTELIDKHQDDCEQRRIQCEACEEMVDLDIFDFHLETCPAIRTEVNGMYEDNYYGYLLRAQEDYPEEQRAPQEENEENSGQPEQDQEEEEEEGEPTSMTFEEMIGFDPSVMTYEQLIALDNTIVKKGLTEEEMSKLPVRVFLKQIDGVQSCTVCISDYESGDCTRKLPCGHQFHKDCVDTWLESNITCPICKKYLR